VARAGIGESARWQLAEAVLVRGRTRPTRVAMPAAGAAGWAPRPQAPHRSHRGAASSTRHQGDRPCRV